MKKTKLNEALFVVLENDLRRLRAANADASAGATHAESRAETKWDTCGLEASYLARGHAQQFKALAADLHELRAFTAPSFKNAPIDVGALVEVKQCGEAMWFYLLPCGGGTELVVDGQEVTVITPESPVGAALMGTRPDDTYTFGGGREGIVLSVL
jgi:hypothetical protein